jgi:ketosteroid isomerase-like protein
MHQTDMQSQTSSQQIDREAVLLAERQWNDAILRRDIQAAKSYMDPSYHLIVGITGQPLSIFPLDAWLSMLPHYRIHEHHTDDIHITLVGNLAVCTLAHRQVADPIQGRDISGSFMLSDIWIRRDEHWLIAERHSSRLEPATAASRVHQENG